MKLLIQLVREILHLSGKSQGISNTYGCGNHVKLYNNPSTVPAIFHNFLRPTTTVLSYNTRSSTELNFYRPQVRSNVGKFTFKYSASVMWEIVPLALKKANTFNKFKKLYKAHLISCQSANISSF